MGKDKLRRFEEIKLLKNVSEFIYNTPFNNSNWTKFLKDNNPVVLELGCGKGEYTVNLAKEDKSKNYIGIDLKGNRLYIGAKQAIDQNLENVHFLRSRIDLIDQCFDQNSVDEIWLTFSDPQPKKPRKRLSSPLFIDRYKKILKPGGLIHLKTDSSILYDYTLEQIKEFKHNLIVSSEDVYKDLEKFEENLQKALAIETHYEKLFSQKGFTIKYCQFSIS